MSQQRQYDADLKKLRADQACEFLLKDPNFINWYHTSDSQQLVILGEMGCGKSVAMSYLVDQLRQREEDQIPKPKICYYYCRDQMTGKDVSVLSVLTLSLLEQLPGLKRRFFDWYTQARKSGDYDPVASAEKLEYFLQKMLEAIDRPVFIVIDGLDECDKHSQIGLLKFLKTLSESISGLKIILSSRPQEKILGQLGQTPRIELGSDVQRDRIIVEKTVDMQLSDLSAEVTAFVINELSDRAQGSAIWTKMTVKLIELRELTTMGEMKNFLENVALPDELSKLYIALLSRCTGNDSENHELATTALKLLTVARRPLSIIELAWAVTLSAAHHVTTVGALGNLVGYRRITSLIHPFISCVDFNDIKKHQVRLLHQSVKEFIMENWISEQLRLQGSAFTVNWPSVN